MGDEDDGAGEGSGSTDGLFVHHEFPGSKWVLPLGFVSGLFYYVDAGWGEEEKGEPRVVVHKGTSTPRQCEVDPRLFDPLFYCPTRLWSTPSRPHLPSSTLMATYRDEPISSFHRAVLSPCQRYFLTIGKHYVGGHKTYRTDRSGEMATSVPWQGYDLCSLRICVEDGSISKYVCEDYHHRLFAHGLPGLFCSSDREAYLCFNYSAHHTKSFEGPAVTIPQIDKYCAFTHASCLFRLNLLDTGRLRIEMCRLVPLPPMKPSRVLECYEPRERRLDPERGPSVRTRMFLDDLHLHLISMPSEHGGRMCIFNFNTDSRAHLYDGYEWRECTADNPTALSILHEGTGPENRDRRLFSVNGRVFFHDGSQYSSAPYTILDGALYEIKIDPEECVYSVSMVCGRVRIPRGIRNLVASGSCLAFSSMNWWRPKEWGFAYYARSKTSVQMVVPSDAEWCLTTPFTDRYYPQSARTSQDNFTYAQCCGFVQVCAIRKALPSLQQLSLWRLQSALWGGSAIFRWNLRPTTPKRRKRATQYGLMETVRLHATQQTLNDLVVLLHEKKNYAKAKELCAPMEPLILQKSEC